MHRLAALGADRKNWGEIRTGTRSSTTSAVSRRPVVSRRVARVHDVPNLARTPVRNGYGRRATKAGEKSRESREIGVPLTRSGGQREVGRDLQNHPSINGLVACNPRNSANTSIRPSMLLSKASSSSACVELSRSPLDIVTTLTLGKGRGRALGTTAGGGPPPLVRRDDRTLRSAFYVRSEVEPTTPDSS
jgi:hypothetical protein